MSADTAPGNDVHDAHVDRIVDLLREPPCCALSRTQRGLAEIADGLTISTASILEVLLDDATAPSGNPDRLRGCLRRAHDVLTLVQHRAADLAGGNP